MTRQCTKGDGRYSNTRRNNGFTRHHRMLVQQDKRKTVQ